MQKISEQKNHHNQRHYTFNMCIIQYTNNKFWPMVGWKMYLSLTIKNSHM